MRERFGYKVDDRMWAFFQKLGVIDAAGRPTAHFGDPRWVYLQYRRARRDAPDRTPRSWPRPTRMIARARGRGVFIATGHGAEAVGPGPGARRSRCGALYEDAKVCIRAELPASFPATLASAVPVATRSRDRDDYILHPPTGETLDEPSLARVDGASRRAARRATTCRSWSPTGSTRSRSPTPGTSRRTSTELRRGS